MEQAFSAEADSATAVIVVAAAALDEFLDLQHERWRNWVVGQGLKPDPGGWVVLPASDGKIEAVLVLCEPRQPLWTLAALPGVLNPGAYTLDFSYLDSETLTLEWLSALYLGWGLGAYRFTRFRASERVLPQLLWPEWTPLLSVQNQVDAHWRVRDLINTPAQALMPEHVVAVAERLMHDYGARLSVTTPAENLADEYPCVWAVGQASAHKPAVLELHWGDENPDQRHIVLVGKGVCFDSGGLNLKTGNGMRLMKKDMGGAAIVLGLAELIMAEELPLRLTVLIGAVENAVGSSAFRPGDVLTARNGQTIEIDNTDAEGRLLLADLLVRAGELKPDWIIDVATLTGAARIAVGTEISAFFTNDEALAANLELHAEAQDDPVWRLPLHQAYEHLLKSDIADTLNSTANGYAGAITAALFLQRFVPKNVPWLHFDLMAWNLRNRPGRPKGGEAMALRALFALIQADAV